MPPIIDFLTVNENRFFNCVGNDRFCLPPRFYLFFGGSIADANKKVLPYRHLVLIGRVSFFYTSSSLEHVEVWFKRGDL
jgi:hypothetical protein